MEEGCFFTAIETREGEGASAHAPAVEARTRTLVVTGQNYAALHGLSLMQQRSAPIG